MIDQEDNINLSKIVVDDNNQEIKPWACLGQTCSRFLNVFLSQLFFILLIIFGCFWRFHLIFLKLLKSPMSRWEFCVVQHDTFYRHQDYEQANFYKNCVSISLVRPSETGKSNFFYTWLQNGTFQSEFDRICFFSSALAKAL